MNVVQLLCGEGLPGDPGGDWQVVPELCADPTQIRTLAAGADRLVLGLHGKGPALSVLQTQMRSAGIDPLGVQIVDMDLAGDDDSRLRTLMEGARARATAYRGSGAEHTKVQTPAEFSRRSMLTFWAPEYVAAPGIDPHRCVASQGCRSCVEVCPRDALSWSAGRVRHDISACEPCGRCVTKCPTGAVENPAVTPTIVEAHVRALVGLAEGPVGIVYVCRRGRSAQMSDNWYPVEVPCTAMVTSTWILAPLVLGAAAASALPCHLSGCPLRQEQVLADHVAHARAILEASGLGSHRVPERLAGSLPEALSPRPLVDPFGANGAAEVVLALLEASDPRYLFQVTSVGSSLGVIEINEEACTGCAACVLTCPTGALERISAEEKLTITFEASLCPACGQCLPRCPEQGAIELHPRTDVAALLRGRSVVYEEPIASCEICGEPIATAAMMSRLGGLLGEDHAGTMRLIGRRCLNCRGVW